MSAITIPSVGGIRPSTLPRALVPNDGQTANNVLARTSEFRPLQNDLVVRVDSGIDNPKTLYRTARDANGNFTSDMTVNWRADAKDVNYVKGQVNDDKTERTYYTQGDGLAAPRVFSVAEVNPNGGFKVGIDKLLGVPAPATAPQGTVNDNYLYTPEARAAELALARDTAVTIIRASASLAWLGVTFGTDSSGNVKNHPGKDTAGYADIYDPNIDNPDHAKVYRVFEVDGPNSTTVIDSFSSSALTAQANPNLAATPPHYGVFDVRLKAEYVNSVGNYGGFLWRGPAPAMDGKWFICVPFYAYGRTYDLDIPGTVANLRAVKMPGNTAAQLFTDQQLTELVTQIKNKYSPSSARIAPLIAALAGEADRFHGVLDSGNLRSVEQVIEKQAQLKLLSDAIGAEYEKIYAELPAFLEQFYYANNINAYVPPGKTRILESRYYICTYVTSWGEESAPSPVSELAEVDEADTVIGWPPNPPSGYNITKFRYYRSNSSNTGAAFQFVGEVDFTPDSIANSAGAKTTVTDDKKSTALGEVCPSTAWLTPPSNMRGLVGMPNGIMVGFFDNTVCPCENYVPYAYPVEYQMTTEYPIVGIGVFGQTAVILTQGNPYFCTGSDAASLSLQKIETPQACVSASSIASSDGGVIYASPDGLCMASSQGVQLITENHFTHEDWTAMNPSSIIGAIHELTYYFLATIGSTQRCYALHMGTGKLTTLDVTGSAFYTDLLTDRLYVARGRSIVALFAGPGYRTGTWRSKIHVSPKQDGFAWLAIESDFSADITVKWYGDRALVYTATVTSRTPVRLPAGRYLEHEIEVVTTARWNKLTIASSTGELQSI